MKTLINNYREYSRKRKQNTGLKIPAVLMALAFVTLVVSESGSQTLQASDRSMIYLPDKAEYNYSDLSIREYDGKIYFNLSVLKDTVGGLLVIERYGEDDNMQLVASKKLIPSNIDSPILYSLVEEASPIESATYKLVKYTKERAISIIEYRHEGEDVFFAEELNR
ncbi:MAG: hypothetical protein KJ607_06040 [Bacteroidetes bacterium]|nr:hypothetical protein [Bacteroidota bacterium]